MRKRFLTSLLVFPICFSLILTGCSLQDLLGNKKKAQSGQNQKPVIAVILNEQDPNKELIAKGIEDMAKKENAQVKFLSSSGEEMKTSSQGQAQESQQKGQAKQTAQEKKDSGKESEQANPLQGAKVLIYQGENAEILDKAQEAKVPIIALNQIPTGIKLAGVVMPNPQKTGELMAQLLVTQVKEGEVVILLGDPSNTVTQELLAGNKLILSNYPKISTKVISSPILPDMTAIQASTPLREQMREPQEFESQPLELYEHKLQESEPQVQPTEAPIGQNLTEYLQKNPGKVQGILAHNDKLATQACEVLKQQNLEKKIKLIGGQATIHSLERVASGGQTGDIDTSPYLLGVNAFQWANKLADKQSVEVNESIASDKGEISAKFVQIKPVTVENVNVVHKSYVATLSAAKQEKEAQAQGKEGKEGKEGQEDKEGKEGSKERGKESSNAEGGEGKGIPPGTAKVTERVKTEIIRDYLDAQGKVIGTEKSASEQVRNVPPEMLKEEMAKGQQGKGEGQGKEEGGKGEKEGEEKK